MEGGADQPRQQRASGRPGAPVGCSFTLRSGRGLCSPLLDCCSPDDGMPDIGPDSRFVRPTRQDSCWSRCHRVHAHGPRLGPSFSTQPSEEEASIPPPRSRRRRSRGARAPGGESPVTAWRLCSTSWRRSPPAAVFATAVTTAEPGCAVIAAVDAGRWTPHAWSTSASSRARPPRSKRGGAGAPLGRRSNAGARRARSSPAPTRAERGLRRGGSAGARDALEWTWWPRTESSSHLDVAASWRYSDGHA